MVVIAKQGNDTIKINSLINLSEKLIAIYKADTALIIAEQALTSSQKLNYKKGEGISNGIIGNTYSGKGKYKDAIKYYNSSIDLLASINERIKLPSIYLNKGNAHLRIAEFEEAKINLLKARELFNANNDKAGIANVYNGLGGIDYSTGKYSDAVENFKKSVSLFEEIGNQLGIANGSNNIGLISQMQGNYEVASTYHNKALDIRKKLNDKNGISMSYLNLGLIAYYKSDLAIAKHYFIECIKYCNITGNKTVLSGAYNNLAAIQIEFGDYENGITTLNQSLKLREETNDKSGIGQTLNGIGSIYLKQGKFKQAEKTINNALKIHLEINDLKNAIIEYHNLGLIQQLQGNNPIAIKNYSLALKLAEKIGDKKGLIQTYNNIGTIYTNQGNYDMALKYIELSSAYSDSIGDKKGVSVNLNNTGLLFKEKNNFPLAINKYNEALKIKTEIKDISGIALTHVNIGDVYRLQKNYKEALNSFNEALKIAKEINEKQIIATVHCNIAQINYENNAYKDVISNGTTAYNYAKEIGDPELIKKSALVLSKGYSKLGKHNEAEKHILEAVAMCEKGIKINFPILSEKEQENYIKTLEPTFRTLYSLAIELKNTKQNLSIQAFNSIVRNKGILLKSSSAMRNSIMKSHDTTLINKYENWITIRKQIAKFYSEGKDASQLEEKSNELEKYLVSSSQAFSSFNNIFNITWKDVQNGLKSGQAVIEFIDFLSENDNTVHYCGLIVKLNSRFPEVVEICSSKSLENVLGVKKETGYNYIQSLYGTNENPNTQLYNLIFLPLEKHLKNINTLYIAPSGLLHKISFASLCRSKNVYLCDNFKLNIISSAEKITSNDKFEITQNSTAAIFGGVNYENKSARTDTSSFMSWPYLPGTLSEAEKINKTLASGNLKTIFLIDSLASEKEFKSIASNNNILHIASHGFFFSDTEENEENSDKNQNNENSTNQLSRGVEYGYGVWSFILNDNPLMRSGIVLAGANGVWNSEEQIDEEDGVLTAQEVSNLDLRNTGLVVLSACETGLGDIKGSEGVYGLQRAFKLAGTKYIIMSLWQVPDKETEEFMNDFYNHLIKQKDVQTAFRQTQESMRKKYEPFYWAPFVLTE